MERRRKPSVFISLDISYNWGKVRICAKAQSLRPREIMFFKPVCHYHLSKSEATVKSLAEPDRVELPRVRVGN